MPDIIFWLVDATCADQGKSSGTQLASWLADGSLQLKEKLIIIVNKMWGVSLAANTHHLPTPLLKGLGALVRGGF
jgi:hypothetical protein